MSDNVNHPKHYNEHPSGIECIQITEHMNFNIGNAMKYLWRSDHKNGIEDLSKAIWYINREMQRLALLAEKNAIELEEIKRRKRNARKSKKD